MAAAEQDAAYQSPQVKEPPGKVQVIQKSLPGEDPAVAAEPPSVIQVPKGPPISHKLATSSEDESDEDMSSAKLSEAADTSHNMQEFYDEAAARLRKVELIQEELSESLYKSSIRMTKKGKSKLGVWHKEHVQAVIKECKKNKEMTAMKDYIFCLQPCFRTMAGSDAKTNWEFCRSTLRALRVEAEFTIIPPYSPEMN